MSSLSTPPGANAGGEGGDGASAAGHTYDYFKDKWDKFDVDKALDEVDAEDSRPAPRSAPEPEGSKPIAAPAPAPELGAADWKERGNAHFKKGAYEAARDCYSRSLERDPTAIAYANRAMASLKEGLLAEAETDCTRALELDPMYLKAYQRRGAARKGLDRPYLAAQDYESALRLEPGSKALRGERQTCLALLQVKENLQPLAGRRHVRVEGPAGAEAAGAGDAPPCGNGGGGEAAVGVTSPEGGGGGGAREEKASPGRLSPRGSAAASARATVSVPRVAQKVPQAAPRTSTEFETAWKATTGDSDARVRLLSLVDPGSLAVLFKNSLTPQLLQGLVETVLEDMVGAGAPLSESGTALLEALPGVPRFDMTAMCLPGKQRAILGGQWDAALERLGVANSGDQAARLASVRKKFRV